MFEPTTENTAIYNEGFKDGKDESGKIENALMVARRYIRTVNSFLANKEFSTAHGIGTIEDAIEGYTTGNEVETIEQALLELGVAV